MATLKRHPRTKLSWDEGYRQLREFFDKNGHSNVNAKVPGLGKWVAVQRKKRDSVTPEQKLLLDELDFTWDSLQEIHEKKWMEMYDTLKAYLNTYPGRMRERGYFSHDEKLQGWVCKVQISYKKGELRSDRINMLEKLDFFWWEKPTQDPTDGSCADMKRKMKNTWLAYPPEKRTRVAKKKKEGTFGPTHSKACSSLENHEMGTADPLSVVANQFFYSPEPPSRNEDFRAARQNSTDPASPASARQKMYEVPKRRPLPPACFPHPSANHRNYALAPSLPPSMHQRMPATDQCLSHPSRFYQPTNPRRRGSLLLLPDPPTPSSMTFTTPASFSNFGMKQEAMAMPPAAPLSGASVYQSQAMHPPPRLATPNNMVAHRFSATRSDYNYHYRSKGAAMSSTGTHCRSTSNHVNSPTLPIVPSQAFFRGSLSDPSSSHSPPVQS